MTKHPNIQHVVLEVIRRNSQFGVCALTVSDIAQAAGCSASTATTAISALRKAQKIGRIGNNSRRFTVLVNDDPCEEKMRLIDRIKRGEFT